ncbi:MAG: hypothetical protein ACYTGP_00070 [Planctomycetota bacterium]|jgi:hypothetical protein
MNDDHLELLISRIVDGDADARTWEEIASIAADRPTVWRELAETQRDHSAIQRTMGRAQAVAETVPTPHAGRGTTYGLSIHTEPVAVRPRWWNWSGWAVAALVALAWAVGFNGLPNGPRLDGSLEGGPAMHEAGLVPISSAQDAFREYMSRGQEEGTVLSTEPRRLLVRTAPAPDEGGIEVIFIQQIMERTVVPDLYQLQGTDEQGRPSLVQYRKTVRGRM